VFNLNSHLEGIEKEISQDLTIILSQTLILPESLSEVFLSFTLISSTSVSIPEKLTSTQEVVFIDSVSETLFVIPLSHHENAI
jgi:hypothetical protein